MHDKLIKESQSFVNHEYSISNDVPIIPVNEALRLIKRLTTALKEQQDGK